VEEGWVDPCQEQVVGEVEEEGWVDPCQEEEEEGEGVVELEAERQEAVVVRVVLCFEEVVQYLMWMAVKEEQVQS
jgi:hypothetical protein